MDADKLPQEHDVIVLGTGMTESIIAAALSRIGLRVLHFDRNDNYGGDWGAFNFTALQQWISALKDKTREDKGSQSEEDLSVHVSSDEKLVLLPVQSSTISNLIESIHIPGKAVLKDSNDGDSVANETLRIDDEITITSSACSDILEGQHNVCSKSEGEAAAEQGTVPEKDEGEGNGEGDAVAEEKKRNKNAEIVSEESLDFAGVTKLWRKFSIDLMPKILYSRGLLVELLISSDVSKYCEFRCITRVLTLLKGKLEVVPCSRADVFASHDVSVIEKRLLMKFLTFAIEYQKHPNQYAGFESQKFIDFLKSKHLTETIQHYVQHAIAMVTERATTMEGLEATQKFLLSLGRYGNTAFLWPLYGSGELLQCFCRMCAVFGGIYCLRRSAQAIILNNNNEVCAIVDTEGQRLETKWVIMDASYASPRLLPQINNCSLLSRGILITDRSVKPHKELQITVMSLPLPGRDDTRATVYELSSLSLACPDGYYVVHLTCQSLADDAKADLQPVVDILFQPSGQESLDDSRPRVIWSLFFNVADTSQADLTCSSIRNLFVVGGPDVALDCDQSVAIARTVFEKICPDEQFLPRAPNPEDIIFDDGEMSQSRESGFESIPEASAEIENVETVNQTTGISATSDAKANDTSTTSEVIDTEVHSNAAPGDDANNISTNLKDNNIADAEAKNSA